MQAVRDNVIFELGLFMGRLGLDRCFILKPRGQPELHLPSDLIGLQALEFNAGRSDANLVAALGPSAHSLRSLFSRLGKTGVPTPSSDAVTKSEQKRNLERYLTIWDFDILVIDRQRANDGLALNIAEDDTGQDTTAVNRILAFFETVCDAASRGEVDSNELDHQLGKSIRQFHEYVGHYFRNAVHGGDVWTSKAIETWSQSRDPCGLKSQ